MLEAALQRLSTMLLIFGGGVLFAMMIHVSADIAMKYTMNQPITGTLEIVSAYYMVGGVFLPMAAVEMTRSSISVDVIYQFFPGWMKLFCMLLVLVGSICFYLVLAYTSLGDSIRSFQIDEKILGTTVVRIWPGRFLLPIGLALAGAVCVFQLYGLLTDEKVRADLLGIHETEEDV